MYGVIDIGSNTIRLSLYKKTNNSIVPMLHKKNMTGLANYVTKDGELSEKGLNKAIRVLAVSKEILSNLEVKDVFIFATASFRNVKNTKEILRSVTEATGYEVDIISGEQEAMYDYVAASHFMDLSDGLLVDIGGGSTELVFYADGKVKKALSMPIGSLNLYSNFVKDIFPTAKELQKIEEKIKSELDNADFQDTCKNICGIGGTIRSAKRLNNEMFDLSDKNKVISTSNINKMLEDFTTDRKLAVQKIIKFAPDRIHTIIPGMIILNMISKKYCSESILVSDNGIREGYLYSKLFLS